MRVGYSLASTDPSPGHPDDFLGVLEPQIDGDERLHRLALAAGIWLRSRLG